MPLLVDTNPQNYADDSFLREGDSGPVKPSETTALLQNKQRLKKAARRKLGRESRMRKRRIVVALILAEMFERVTYYGVVTNLVLFLNSNFHWHMLASASAVFVFLFLSSFMSAVGGLVADSRLIGRYRTISSGFVVYLLGTIFLVVLAALLDYGRRHGATTITMDPWLVLVLICIACGQGALKANLSAFGADQLQRVKSSKSSRIFFNWFYWLANVGAILVLLGITYIQQIHWKYGFLTGFGLLAISMTIAMTSFLSCRKYYVISDPQGTGLRHMWLIVKQAWSKRHDTIVSRELTTNKNQATYRASKISFLDKTTVAFGGTFLEAEVNELRSFGKAILVSAALIPYWMIYSQIYSTFLLQGIYLQSGLKGGFKVPAAWLGLFESMAVLVLVPITQRILYPACSRCSSNSLPILWRIIIGMVFATAAVGMAGYVEFTKAALYTQSPVYINQTASVKVYRALEGYYIFWQLPQYALIGMSEVFTGISGLELVYLLCPTTPQSVISSVYNLMMSAGNLSAFGLLIIVSTYNWFPSSKTLAGIEYLGNQQVAYYYWLLGGIMILAIFCLLITAYCANIEQSISMELSIDQQSLVSEDRTTSSTSRSTPGLSSDGDFSPAELPGPHIEL